MSNVIDRLISVLNVVNPEPPEIRREILDKFQEYTLEEKAEKSAERAKKKGKEYIVVLSSPTEIDLKDVTASVWIAPEGFSIGDLIPTLQSAAVDQNEFATKKKTKIQSFGDAIAFLKPKFMKNKNIKRLSKEPMAVLAAPVEFIPNVEIK